MSDTDDLKSDRERAESLIAAINRCLPTWRIWFPKESSLVEVSRADLLAMKKYAEIGLEITHD